MTAWRTSGGHTVDIGCSDRYVFLDVGERVLAQGTVFRTLAATRLTARQARRIARTLLAMADEVEPEVPT